MENVKFEEDGQVFEQRCLENVRLEEKEEKHQKHVHAEVDDWDTREENYKDKDNESAEENKTSSTGASSIGGNLLYGDNQIDGKCWSNVGEITVERNLVEKSW